jgi:hypothetical protein
MEDWGLGDQKKELPQTSLSMEGILKGRFQRKRQKKNIKHLGMEGVIGI